MKREGLVRLGSLRGQGGMFCPHVSALHRFSGPTCKVTGIHAQGSCMECRDGGEMHHVIWGLPKRVA
jgi:hypothetical protein